jgi:hypothetical protein
MSLKSFFLKDFTFVGCEATWTRKCNRLALVPFWVHADMIVFLAQLFHFTYPPHTS